MPDDNTQTTTNPIPAPSNPAPVSDTPASAFSIPTPVSDDATTLPAVPAADDTPAVDDTVVAPEGPLADALEAAAHKGDAPDTPEILKDVAGKISDSQNILIALSSDPSVDELSAAIGLSLYLDKIGKRATAIYSGTTPNALEFLSPEETFESTADTLQDFVIALNKDKADHLRYKLDGDYVKVYITPYKSRISDEDLEFSYGDFNIDLVLALDVANGIDLDEALREHGRIMHDAVIVNITTGKPGKLAEVEWSDTKASSVSEMIAELLYTFQGENPIEKDEATALLTGIVAATDRFSSASTTPETMKISSKLMESGADQQLISKNITSDIENEMLSFTQAPVKERDLDPTKLNIEHEDEETGEDETEEVDTPIETETEDKEEPAEENEMLDDLKEAEESLAGAGAEVTPAAKAEPLSIGAEPAVNLPEPTLPEPVASAMASEPSSEEGIKDAESEKVIAPSADFSAEASDENVNKYGQMLEDALNEDGGIPTEPTAPIVNPPEEMTPPAMPVAPAMPPVPVGNPAASAAPSAPSAPEINGVPEINYMPLPSDEVLPPPPTPPVDFSAPAPMAEPLSAPAAPAAPAEVPSPVEMGGQPAMQDQVYTPQATNPDAFKIPGM